MDQIKFFCTDSLVAPAEQNKCAQQLAPEIARIQQARTQQYTTDYASINAPFDEEVVAHVLAIAQEKLALQPTLLVLIGIGGSNLGTLAVYNALRDAMYYRNAPGGGAVRPELVEGSYRMVPDFLCIDTIDAVKLTRQLHYIEQKLKAGERILINAISKSGTTTETIINFELVLALLKRYHPSDYQQFIVVTSDDNSACTKFAMQQQFTSLTLPQKVGGRFSIFTTVGLFPLAILGIDIKQLLAGARASIAACLNEQIEENPAAISASIKYALYQQGMNIHDMFVFATDLETMGLWYRQLLGESIGKEYNRNKQKIEVGITPTVSIGTTDLHSVGQLALGGPRDKLTTFVSVKNSSSLHIPLIPEFEQFVANIQGRPVADVMRAILHGVQQAYRSNKRPFCSIELSQLNEHTMGQLLQFYMIETMYLGYLFEVNPFDQPNVEMYKTETRRILLEQKN